MTAGMAPVGCSPVRATARRSPRQSRPFREGAVFESPGSKWRLNCFQTWPAGSIPLYRTERIPRFPTASQCSQSLEPYRDAPGSLSHFKPCWGKIRCCGRFSPKLIALIGEMSNNGDFQVGDAGEAEKAYEAEESSASSVFSVSSIPWTVRGCGWLALPLKSA